LRWRRFTNLMIDDLVYYLLIAAIAVPFEPFSFFVPTPGWHDRWSKTRVVLTR
jgi:hypothetical protein